MTPYLNRLGSPPLVRERLFYFLDGGIVTGITPARAGKTQASRRSRQRKQDHPRSCGKDLMHSNKGLCNPGSPPLVRERQWQCRHYRQWIGITPARAGKTISTSLMRRPSRDHPRSCGKDNVCNNFFPLEPGSPPLVRERLRLP